jgi:hypothetical protein
MSGTTGTARQASAGGHARHTAAADRAAPIDGTARQPASAVQIPPLTDPQGNDVTGRWPLQSFLELGAFVPASQAEVPSPDYLMCPFNAPDLLGHIFRNHGPQIAAVLADLCPVRGRCPRPRPRSPRRSGTAAPSTGRC